MIINVQLLLTGVVIILSGFSYLRYTKKIEDSPKITEAQKISKIKVFKILSKCVFALGIVTIVFSFIFAHEYDWKKRGEISYSTFVLGEGSINIVQMDKETFDNYQDFFIERRSYFNEKNYTVTEKELPSNEKEKIRNYVKSFSQMKYCKSNYLVVLCVSSKKKIITQKLFLVHFTRKDNSIEIDYIDKYLEAVENK